MKQFLQQLHRIPEVAELVRRVEDGGCPVAVSGLQPVQRACVSAAVAYACDRPAVFVCGDEREVRQLAGDLETLTGEKPVILLSREWKLRPGAILPVYGSKSAAGADLCACIDGETVITPGQTVFIPTGLAFEIPEGYAGFVHARSGLASKRGLAPANKVGVIDADYRGEVMVALHNHGKESQTVEAGERVAQMIIAPFVAVNYVFSDELDETVRGEGGFGSTGRK